MSNHHRANAFEPALSSGVWEGLSYRYGCEGLDETRWTQTSLVFTDIRKGGVGRLMKGALSAWGRDEPGSAIFRLCGKGISHWRGRQIHFALRGFVEPGGSGGGIDQQLMKITLIKRHLGSQFCNIVQYGGTISQNGLSIQGTFADGLFRLRQVDPVTHVLARELTGAWDGESSCRRGGQSSTTWKGVRLAFQPLMPADGRGWGMLVTGGGESLWQEKRIPFCIVGRLSLPGLEVELEKQHVEGYLNRIAYFGRVLSGGGDRIDSPLDDTPPLTRLVGVYEHGDFVLHRNPGADLDARGRPLASSSSSSSAINGGISSSKSKVVGGSGGSGGGGRGAGEPGSRGREPGEVSVLEACINLFRRSSESCSVWSKAAGLHRPTIVPPMARSHSGEGGLPGGPGTLLIPPRKHHLNHHQQLQQQQLQLQRGPRSSPPLPQQPPPSSLRLRSMKGDCGRGGGGGGDGVFGGVREGGRGGKPIMAANEAALRKPSLACAAVNHLPPDSKLANGSGRPAMVSERAPGCWRGKEDELSTGDELQMKQEGGQRAEGPAPSSARWRGEVPTSVVNSSSGISHSRNSTGQERSLADHAAIPIASSSFMLSTRFTAAGGGGGGGGVSGSTGTGGVSSDGRGSGGGGEEGAAELAWDLNGARQAWEQVNGGGGGCSGGDGSLDKGQSSTVKTTATATTTATWGDLWPVNGSGVPTSAGGSGSGTGGWTGRLFDDGLQHCQGATSTAAAVPSTSSSSSSSPPALPPPPSSSSCSGGGGGGGRSSSLATIADTTADAYSALLNENASASTADVSIGGQGESKGRQLFARDEINALKAPYGTPAAAAAAAAAATGPDRSSWSSGSSGPLSISREGPRRVVGGNVGEAVNGAGDADYSATLNAAGYSGNFYKRDAIMSGAVDLRGVDDGMHALRMNCTGSISHGDGFEDRQATTEASISTSVGMARLHLHDVDGDNGDAKVESLGNGSVNTADVTSSGSGGSGSKSDKVHRPHHHNLRGSSAPGGLGAAVPSSSPSFSMPAGDFLHDDVGAGGSSVRSPVKFASATPTTSESSPATATSTGSSSVGEHSTRGLLAPLSTVTATTAGSSNIGRRSSNDGGGGGGCDSMATMNGRGGDGGGGVRDGEERCKMCFLGSVDAVLLPCGHLCACQSCASTLHACPICKAEVFRVQPVYRS